MPISNLLLLFMLCISRLFYQVYAAQECEFCSAGIARKRRATALTAVQCGYALTRVRECRVRPGKLRRRHCLDRVAVTCDKFENR